MQIFICTVGTSLSSKCFGEGDKRVTELETLPVTAPDHPTAKYVLGKLQRYIADQRNYSDQRDTAAELTGLYRYAERLGLTLDQVVEQVELLHSDNLLGLICAQALQYALQQYIGLDPDKIGLHRIKGLDAKREATIENGIANLSHTLAQLLHKYKSKADANEVVLNATGGYKILMPYMTLAGTLFKCEVIYVFVEARALLELPPLPFDFDVKLLSNLKPVLKLLYNDQSVTKWPSELAESVSQLTALIQLHEGQLRLTPVGWLVAGRYQD